MPHILTHKQHLYTQLNGRLRTADIPEADTEYISFELSQFTIYQGRQSTSPEDTNDEAIEPEREVNELQMVPLHFLKTKRGCNELVLDATVTYAGASFHLRGVPFNILSIEGYGDETYHSVANAIWIQTPFGKGNNVWYRLATPSAEYLRFHFAFLWIADLGKHFVDYLEANSDIHLTDFRSNFHDWITVEHGQSAEFRAWIQQFGKTDFRTTIAAHIEYLWNEAGNVIRSENKLRRHHIWAEAWSNAPSYAYGTISRQENTYAKKTFAHTTITKTGKRKTSTFHYTIVTPFVYNCFRGMYFGATLEERHIKSPAIRVAQGLRQQNLGFVSDPEDAYMCKTLPIMGAPTNIRAGDVVGVPRDMVEGKKKKWKDTALTWFGKNNLHCTHFLARTKN